MNHKDNSYLEQVNLSFNNNMTYFAKAINEEMPEDRYKASQNERRILNSLARWI